MRTAFIIAAIALAGCEPPAAATNSPPRDLAGEVTRLQHEVAGIKGELAAMRIQLAGHREAFDYTSANIGRLEMEINGTPAARYAHESTRYALIDLLGEIDRGEFEPHPKRRQPPRKKPAQ